MRQQMSLHAATLAGEVDGPRGQQGMQRSAGTGGLGSRVQAAGKHTARDAVRHGRRRLASARFRPAGLPRMLGGMEQPNCYVYRAGKRADTYLFVPRKDDFERVPDVLRQALGSLSLVLELHLAPGRRLARTGSADVLADFDRQGYHLQLPPAPQAPA